MFCEKCGTPNPDGSQFCQNCGASMASAPAAAVAAPAAPAAAPAKPKNVLLIAGIAVAAIVIIVAAILILTAPTTIVLDDYLTVEIEGYDGIGRAHLNWDTERMLIDMCKDLDENEAKTLALALFAKKLDLELDKTSELFNGETLTLMMIVDEDFFDMYNLKIKLKKTEYVVEGLKESTLVNPFDFLKISYEGYTPYANLVLENTSTDAYLKENLYFYADNDYDLQEGETFTVTVNFSEYDAAQNGYVITTTSKDFTATGLAEPEEIDLFDMLTITYTGVDGSGQMEYTVEEADEDDYFLSNVYFRCDKSYNLTTGDTITFSVNYYGEPERYGYKVVSDTKTVTVPQLGTYVKSFDDLSTDVQKALLTALQDAATAEYAKNSGWGYLYTGTSIFSTSYDMEDYASISNVSLTHTYACRVTSWGSTYNRIGIIYTIDLAGHKTAAANCTAYSYTYIDNVILRADGTLEEGWEENINVEDSAFTTYDLMYSKRFNGNDTLVITEQE